MRAETHNSIPPASVYGKALPDTLIIAHQNLFTSGPSQLIDGVVRSLVRAATILHPGKTTGFSPNTSTPQ